MARRKAGPAVVVVCGKGGDTKSTSTGALADAAARAGRRVLAVDLDAQGTLSRWLVAEPEGQFTVADVMGGTVRPEDAAVSIWRQDDHLEREADLARAHPSARLDVLVAEPVLGELEHGDQRPMLAALVQAAAVYDLVVIDTAAWRPAGPSAALQVAALWHASRALLPVEPAAASVANLPEVLGTIAELGRQRRKALPVSLLPTRVGARESDAAAVTEVLAQTHHVLPVVRRSAYARRAMLAHRTLEGYAMHTNSRAMPLAEDYRSASAALLFALGMGVR